MLANATTLCILSPIPLFLVSTFNNGLAIGIACATLLGMVALAVFIFIKIGIKLSPLQYLEQEPLETEYGVTGLVKEKNQSYQDHYFFLSSMWCCSMYFICNSVDYCRLHGSI